MSLEGKLLHSQQLNRHRQKIAHKKSVRKWTIVAWTFVSLWTLSVAISYIFR